MFAPELVIVSQTHKLSVPSCEKYIELGFFQIFFCMFSLTYFFKLSCFVLFINILYHLVLFFLFRPYFALILRYFWHLFSWLIIHRIDKVGQNCRYPPPPNRLLQEPSLQQSPYRQPGTGESRILEITR